MEQIINQNPKAIINDKSLLKSHAESKSLFLSLIKSDSVNVVNNKLSPSIKSSVDQSTHDDFFYKSQGIDRNNQSFTVNTQYGDILALDLSSSVQIDKQKYELYEQKWFSIGKLSYIDSDKYIKQGNNHISNSANPTNLNIKIDNGDIDNVVISEKIHFFKTELANVQGRSERNIKNKSAIDLSGLSAHIKIDHDIEKKKISFLKDKESTMLAIRDYHAEKSDVLSYIKNLLQLAKVTISKIALNGKVVK